eukprot:scaffold295853_cov17-Tisochrysis_lutea.AAC.2
MCAPAVACLQATETWLEDLESENDATEARLEALEADNDVGNEQGAGDSDDEEFMVAGDEDEEEGGYWGGVGVNACVGNWGK